MKYINISLFFSILFLSFNASAQTLEYNNEIINFEKKDRPAIVITLSPETKDVKKAWKKFLQKKHDVDVDGLGLFTNKEVLRVEKAIVASITDKEIDLSAKIVEEGELTKMMVFGSFGYDLYISPQKFPKEYAAMENIVFDFLNDLLPEYLQENVEDLEKNLSDMKDDREDKLKTVEKNKEDIADNEKEIEKLKKENEKLGKELEESQKSVTQMETKLRIKKRKVESVENTLIEVGNRN